MMPPPASFTPTDLTHATFTRRPGVTEARMSMMLDNHLDEVWSAITEPAQLAQWLAPGRIELRPGGAVRIDFADSGVVIDSAVTAIDPPHILEYDWSGPGEPRRPVLFELEPIGAAVCLTLTVTAPAGEDAARAAAGWAAHLDMLAAALAGAPTKFPLELFIAARDAYRAELAV